MKTERISRPVPLTFVLFSIVSITQLVVAEDKPSSSLERRPPWTTSRITGSPEPPLPYTTERVFPSLKFENCLDITPLPNSNRLVVAEQGGKILSFPNGPDVDNADLMADIAKDIEGAKNVYAITFHPDFENNPYCYICYIKAPNLDDGTHVARFRVTDTDPPTIDTSSETTLITWLSGGHNGCCLKFGPDGCLYISTGDGAPANPPDAKQVGQDITNILSCILRIDVDHADDGRSYRIPPDNPFVDVDGARGEIWAYGFRNPWRMSFDDKSGDLWVGDVGWELWEMLDRVERGGNYGWSVMEGNQMTNPEWTRGPTPILPPTIDHPHSESSSVTGGLTYYGSRLKELTGTHIYGDYDTGKFWGFRFENGQVVDHRELADTSLRVVGFGADPTGEFYVLDHPAGTIHRLIPNPDQDTSATFPRKLSDSGLFSSVAEQTPAPGVIPYSINAEPWADHAVAERFVAVPDGGQVKAEGAKWSFPKDSVLAKTLSLDMEHGNADSRRRIETQILHYDGTDWQPYTYRWNDDQSDAVLVDAAGAEQVYEVVDSGTPGGIRRQTWRFSGRAECQRCHNKWSGPVLAFNTQQLHRTHDFGDTIASQIDAYAQIGLIEKAVPTENRPALARPSDETADRESRARAYLDVNCSHCHRKHAGGAVLSQMHYDVKLADTNMIGVRPSQGTFGIHAAQVVAPGDPLRSVLLYRMSKLGGGRMPHIGSTEVDRDGVALIDGWIREIPVDAAQDDAGRAAAAKLRAAEAADLERLLAISDSESQGKLVDELLASTSGALMLLRSIDEGRVPASATTVAIAAATRHQDIRVRDLFERFLPPDQRVARLGNVVRPDQILSLTGNAERGRQVFFATAGVSCKNCHRVGTEGKEIGPELTAIGRKLNRPQLLESILEPSKRIDPKFVTYLVETVEGRLVTGLLVNRSDGEVVLKDAQDKRIRISTEQIEELVAQGRSLMPELLVRDMTAQQVADLIEYLSTLR